MGGKQMSNLSNIIKNKLTSGVEMLLVVGNMGETIVYPLPSNEALVYSPAQKSSTYIPFSSLVRRIFCVYCIMYKVYTKG